MNEIIRENNYPNTCPHCGEKINPSKIHEHRIREWGGDEIYEGIFICNNKKCDRAFSTLFRHNYITNYNIEMNSNILYFGNGKFFPDEINNISPSFSNIYNEALVCENNLLKQIAGMGYRKAFEFLIKDYLLNIEERNAEIISLIKEKPSITFLIKEYITDNNELKEMAERCAWLGNDQIHYIVKHTDKDLEDLKEILETVVYYISMKIKTKKYSNITKK